MYERKKSYLLILNMLNETCLPIILCRGQFFSTFTSHWTVFEIAKMCMSLADFSRSLQTISTSRANPFKAKRVGHHVKNGIKILNTLSNAIELWLSGYLYFPDCHCRVNVQQTSKTFFSLLDGRVRISYSINKKRS
jgi:hypothetical protein